VDPGERCQTASAIRTEVAGVTLKALPLCRSAGRRHRGGYHSAASEGLNQFVVGKNKASSSSAHQNCAAQITPHEICIISRWGDFHSDGTPGTIKPNYENMSPLPVHRCSAGAGGVGSKQTSLDKNMLLFWLYNSRLMHI